MVVKQKTNAFILETLDRDGGTICLSGYAYPSGGGFVAEIAEKVSTHTETLGKLLSLDWTHWDALVELVENIRARKRH